MQVARCVIPELKTAPWAVAVRRRQTPTGGAGVFTYKQQCVYFLQTMALRSAAASDVRPP